MWWAAASWAVPALASDATSSGTTLLAYITKDFLLEVLLGLTNSPSSESHNMLKMEVREDLKMNPQGLLVAMLSFQINFYVP